MSRQRLFRSRPRPVPRTAGRRKRVGLSRPRAPSPERDDGQINNFWRNSSDFEHLTTADVSHYECFEADSRPWHQTEQRRQSPADCEFADPQKLRAQRMAGTMGRTAASDHWWRSALGRVYGFSRDRRRPSAAHGHASGQGLQRQRPRWRRRNAPPTRRRVSPEERPREWSYRGHRPPVPRPT